MGRAASCHSSCPRGVTAYTGIGARQASVAALVSPREPAPFGGQEHYTAQEAFTLDGDLHPLHTCNLWVSQLTCPTGAQHCTQLVGRTTACLRELPQGWCREEGRCEGEGPASAVTSTFDQVLLLWPLPQGLVPRPPALGVLWVPFCCPGQGQGLSLGIQ